MCRILRNLFLCVAALGASPLAHAAPDHVDITWMSITNMHFALGRQQILADGYITRLPQEVFFGGANGFDSTRRAVQPDLAAVTEVFDAIGGKSAVNLLLTGHSHFDHSFDTATWARLSGARVIGSPTTCLQVRAAEDSRAPLHTGVRRREVHARARRRHVCDPLESQRRSGKERRAA